MERHEENPKKIETIKKRKGGKERGGRKKRVTGDRGQTKGLIQKKKRTRNR